LTKHPTIAKYFHEQKYWMRLGIHADPRPLDERPWREVHEYDIIMDEQTEHEKPKSRPTMRGGSR
jgi:hypothetical protein